MTLLRLAFSLLIATSLVVTSSSVASAAPVATSPATTITGKAPVHYLVTMRSGVVGAATSSAASIGLPAGVKMVRRISSRTLMVTATPAALKSMRANRAIEEIVPDMLMRRADLTNDPRVGEQWSLSSTDSASVGINLAAAWAATRGSGSVHVAVIDTGILADHPDLNGQWSGGYDMIADPTNANDGGGRDADPTDPGDYGIWGDSSWHGSHVAGTIAANDDNEIGITGIAPGVTITPVRVLGSEGAHYSDVIDAIRWSAGLAVAGAPLNPDPADVINLSLGGYGDCFTELQSAVDEAIAAGSVIVVAAGNSGEDPIYFAPANCDGVITVASTGPGGAPAWYTNRGASVEISAPGGDTSDADANGILSTINTSSTSPGAGDPGYAFYQGTSMAAPHVAGVVALMRSMNPNLSPEVIGSIIAETATLFTSAGSSPCTTADCGAGLIDAGAAVAAAASTVTGETPNATLSAPTTILLGETGELRLQTDSPATPNIRVIGERCTLDEPTVDGDDLVWLISTTARGDCRFLLHQPAASGYASSYLSATLRVVGLAAPVSFTIGDCSADPCTIDGSRDYTLLSASAAGDQYFAYESQTPESCMVESSVWDGEAFDPGGDRPSISLYGLGACTITATSSGDTTYEGSTTTASATVVYGTTTTLTATGMGHGGLIRVGSDSGVWVRHSATGGLTVTSTTPRVCDVDPDSSWYAAVWLIIRNTGNCALRLEGGATAYAAAPPALNVTLPVVLAWLDGALPSLTLRDSNAYSDATVYTNSLQVYVESIWPDMSTSLRLGRDRSVCSRGTRSIPDSPTSEFTLASGSDGLRTVYACYTTWSESSSSPIIRASDACRVRHCQSPPSLNPASLSRASDRQGVYSDSIILDRSAPSLRSAKISSKSYLSGSSYFAAIDWSATDRTSGLAGLEVADSSGDYLAGVIYGSGPTWVRLRTDVTSILVRAVDRAGNVSSWKTVTITLPRR